MAVSRYPLCFEHRKIGTIATVNHNERAPPNFNVVTSPVSGIGQIKSGSFPGVDDLYVKLTYVYGPDWSVIAGIEDGITQVSKKSSDVKATFVWNFPLELTFKSTNPYGWPQLALSVYGPDLFGNDVIRGYGVCHLPTSPGKCEKRIPMFIPVSSSPLQKLVSYFTGRRPEFVDPRVVARGEGRDMTLVASQGFIDIEYQIRTKDLQKLGFEGRNTKHN